MRMVAAKQRLRWALHHADEPSAPGHPRGRAPPFCRGDSFMATIEIAKTRSRLAMQGVVMLLGVALGGALVFVGLYITGMLGAGTAKRTGPQMSGEQSAAETSDKVEFAESKWKAAGLRIEPAKLAPLTEVISRPGKIALNHRKVAHLSPMVEGIVREVHVRPGQDVKAGDVLVVLDSKELGQVKLDLVKARLGLSVAKAQHAWVKEVNRNAAELLQAMGKGADIADIEKQFTGRPIGDWRQQLVTAYSRSRRTKTHLQAVEKLDKQGAVSAVTLRTAQGDHETAAATYLALREEIHFQNQQQWRTADQKLREAEGQVHVAETFLLMVGYGKAEVSAMDPIAEGPKIAQYPIRAPFDGTVLAVPSSLAERASPQAAVVQMGDLSWLWVQADLTESDLPAVRGLRGKSVTFRGPGLSAPGEALVLRVGDIVDKTTRTIPLLAHADNAERRLKPGMFVEVEIRHGPATPVLQVPSSAIQRHANETFVFVHKGEDDFERVGVRLGRATADHVEITHGLAAGQPVVVGGGFALKTEMLRATLNPE
jgi:cobalt-zinc-cadmium efflux system membrane fusion protein